MSGTGNKGTRKGEYERIAERAARGEFELVEPFDYLLLGYLPDEGSLFAGLYPLGENVPNLIKKFPKVEGAPIPGTQITGRLHSMKDQGLVLTQNSLTNGRAANTVWQRTERGSKLFTEWQESQKGKAKADGPADSQ